MVPAREQALQPASEPAVRLRQMMQRRASPVHEQAPQIDIAALADAKSFGLPPVVAWRGTKPSQAASRGRT